ncbi:MAG: thiolase family protein [Candidatus Nanopelagicales bacterium]|nr:thiolase family protein [Candidatus Nanopelagicales bacterium]
MAESVVIVSGARTPIGSYMGALSSIPTHKLGSMAAREAMSRAGISPEDVDEVVMGCIGQVGPEAYNARLVSIDAGIPTTSTAYNVNRLCGSGLQAILSGAMQIQLGQSRVVVAGGNENMSAQPFLEPAARAGAALGNRTLVDGTLSLVTDPWGDYPMGRTAENVARAYNVARQAQDEWAVQSQARTAQAMARNAFGAEMFTVDVPGKKGAVTVVESDEHPRPQTTLDVLAKLRPSFSTDGTVTAGNSSGINDAGAATVLMLESEARERGLSPMGRLVGWASHGCDPALMGYAPVGAISKVLDKLSMSVSDLDVVELNEAFAAQVVAVIRDAGLDPERTNPNGGAIALGHPVGATGAILTNKLLHDLHARDLDRGLVTMCIGGGQALAAVFERV